MFDLKEAYSNITIEDIYSRVTEYQLWKQYCKNFEKLDISFKSEFYDDKNPSCRIYSSINNKLRYKDFGTGENFSVMEYIQKKYNCTFSECINIIANDFNIRKNTNFPDINKKILINDYEEIVKIPKSRIEIVQQPFTIADYTYWNQYHIPLDLLITYNVMSCKVVYLIKGDKITTFEYTNTNPIYAYKFMNDKKISYKIYFPYADKKYKWLFSGGSADDIEGYDQLDWLGDNLILTKSLKDCMCYRLLGYNAISLQGEHNKLEGSLVDKLLKRYERIIVNYDNDESGIKAANKITKSYKLNSFIIDDAKDLSDYIKEYGISKAKKLIDGKINKSII